MTNKTLLTHRNSLLYRKYIKERVRLVHNLIHNRIHKKKLISLVDMFCLSDTLRFKASLGFIVGYYIDYKYGVMLNIAVVSTKFSYIGRKRSEYENNI